MTDSPEDTTLGESPLGALGDLLAGARERLTGLVVEGAAGGGAVRVTMDGERRLRAISISREAMASGNPAELEELVLAAVNEAWRKADDARMAAVTGMFPGFTT